MNCALTLLVRNWTWRSGLLCEKAISFASSISSVLDWLKVEWIACPTAFATLSICRDFRVDLLAQVAQEVLLARDAHEVRVEVAEAHVGERVVVAELLVAGLEVDGREVFADRAAADVAVVDVHVGAAERVDHFDEALEVDVDDPVELQPGEHFALDRFGGERAAAVDAFEPAAERVGGVDLFVRVVGPFRRADVDHQVARDRQHRGLALLRVEADEQDRVAVRFAAFEGVLRLRPPVRAEHEEGLRLAAVVLAVTRPCGDVDLVPLREDLLRRFL